MSNILKQPSVQPKPSIPIRQPNITKWIPEPLKASCGCGEIKDEAYLYSNAEQKAYCDTYCLVKTEAEYEGDNVRWMDELMTIEQFKKELEVVSYG